MSFERMSEDLGYTKEELDVMLNYLLKQAEMIEAKEKVYLENGQILNEILTMDKSVFHD